MEPLIYSHFIKSSNQNHFIKKGLKQSLVQSLALVCMANLPAAGHIPINISFLQCKFLTIAWPETSAGRLACLCVCDCAMQLLNLAGPFNIQTELSTVIMQPSHRCHFNYSCLFFSPLRSEQSCLKRILCKHLKIYTTSVVTVIYVSGIS